MVPLALACRQAGHDVAFAIGAPFIDRLPVPTVPIAVSAETVHDASARAEARMAAGTPPHVALTDLFGTDLAEPTLAALQPLFTDRPPDLVVTDGSNPGAAVAAAQVGVPHVWFSVTAPHPATAGIRTHTFARHPEAGALVPRPGFDPTLAVLQHEKYPEDLHPVPLRPEPWSPDGDLPVWTTPRGQRPRALLTLGTEFNDAQVLGRAARGLAAEGVEVLLALGPRIDEADLGAVPDGVHVRRFVQQRRALGQVDVVVHHGGSGTVVGAVTNGLPQVLLPQGADQFWNTECLVSAGAAVRAESDGSDVAAAVLAVATDRSAQRSAAQRLREQLESMPPAATVAERLEELT